MKIQKKKIRTFTILLQTTITVLTVAQTKFARTDMRVVINNLDVTPARRITQSEQIQYGKIHINQ